MIDTDFLHAAQVQAIAAAPGNTEEGMTGVMWRGTSSIVNAALQADNPSLPTMAEMEEQGRKWVEGIRQSIRWGSDVINLSMATSFFEPVLENGDTMGWRARLPAPGADQDQQQVEGFAIRVFRAISFAESDSNPDDLPLYVIAAGNYGMDAYYSGLPRLAQGDSPIHPRVLIVTGSDSTVVGDGVRALWRNAESSLNPGSSTGPLVHVAAPGASLTLPNLGDNLAGTSFAAPHVAGLAGLLKSFDSRLNAEEIKELIIEGAERGGRSAEGIPYANAYESLKAAAERPGAPLCGNRVWAEAGQIYAQRGGGREALGPAEAQLAPWSVNTVHGGRHIRYETVEGARALRWTESGAWELGGLPAGYVRGGTDASVYGFSHDQDTVAIFSSSAVNGTQWWHQEERAEAVIHGHEVLSGDGGLSLGDPWELARIEVEHTQAPVRLTCIEREYDREREEPGPCRLTIAESRFWIFRLGYPQNGTDLYAVSSPLRVVPADTTAWDTCSHDENLQCRGARMDQRHAPPVVHRVDIETGDATFLGGFAQQGAVPDSAAVFWIGQSEGEPALVLGRGQWRIHTWYDAEHFRQTGDPVKERGGDIEHCAIEYRTPAGLALDDQIETRNVCNWEFLDYPSQAGGGNISPSIVGTSGAEFSAGAGGTVIEARAYGLTAGGVEALRW